MASFSIESIGDDWYLITDGTTRWRVAAVQHGDASWVCCDGRVQVIPTAASAGRPRAKTCGDAGVMAPMPATVVAVNVAAGQSVKQGDTLIVLEAMKMELPILAARDATVSAVHCAKGDLVQPGVNLLEFA